MAQTAPVLEFEYSGRIPDESATWCGTFANLAASSGLPSGRSGEGAFHLDHRLKHISKSAHAAVDRAVDKAVGKPVIRSVGKSVRKPTDGAVEKFVVKERIDDRIRF